ncbi:hypothetical protein ACLOJK_027021 [Asimina triloba]
MWFLANLPGEATIEVKCMDHFNWLHDSIRSISKQMNSVDPQNISILNRLWFYLPEVFPALDKIVLLDHDVVVQRDLRGLWSIDMKGKVNAAVETCGNTESSKRMGMFLNFSDPTIAKRFDINACTWAFGMNVIDLREWRQQDLTSIYHKWLQLGNGKQLWKEGSLSLGLVIFYDLTVALDPRWHIHGLGYNSGVGKKDIKIAAVIHYDGSMKPWLEIAIGKYKNYWNKYLKYDHQYLLECNIHK